MASLSLRACESDLLHYAFSELEEFGEVVCETCSEILAVRP
jgi:hypothetical protein